MGIRQIIDCDGCRQKNIKTGSYVSFHVGFSYGGPETECDYEELYLCKSCTTRLSELTGELVVATKLIPYSMGRQKVCQKKGFDETAQVIKLLKEGQDEKLFN